MISTRLLRTLLIALIALGLSFYIAEKWPSRSESTSVQTFCAGVVANQPFQQVLARATGLQLSTMVTGDYMRVYSVAGKDHAECHIELRGGLVADHRLLQR